MNAPEVMYHISQTQLSVARYYGSCKFNGKTYLYCPVDDTLIREDVLKKRKEWRVIRAGDSGDEWLGEPCKTRAAAMMVAKADRSGRLVCLFGPDGVDRTSFLKDGKAAQ